MRLVAFGDRGERDVRDLEQRAIERLLRSPSSVLEPRDLVAERPSLRDQLVGVFFGALASCDFLRVRVARRLSLFDRLNQRAAFTLQLHAAVDKRR